MEIIKADTIEQYNRFFGFETRHPLVDIVHFDRSENQPTHKMTFGFYALFLEKGRWDVPSITGRQSMILTTRRSSVSLRGKPSVFTAYEDGPVPEADALLFHPDFLHRTALAQKMKQYSFFSYASNEALHLSADERVICAGLYMQKIARELERPIDRFSKPLIIFEHRGVAQLLYAFLRAAVCHARRVE